MLTINSSFPVLMIEIRKKLKKSTKYQACEKFTKNMHMPQFFQPTLLNSKFLYKRGALPCAGKHSEHSCTSSKKNVLKALFVSCHLLL